MFDSLKKSLGLSKARQESKGNRLGTAEEAQQSKKTASNTPGYEIYERYFNQQKLGMAIVESGDLLPIDGPTKGPISHVLVDSVASGSEANQNGVLPGDIIIALNGSQLQQFGDFYAIIPALERPVLIRFFRPLKPAAPRPPQIAAPSANLLGTVFGKSSNNQGSNASTLSDAELEARREERLRAVQDRTDKKYKSKAGKSPTSSSSGAQANNVSQENITAGDALHPETLRVIAETKKGEKQVEAQLGYSPFRPHMSFSGGGSAAAVASMQQMASTTTAPNHPGAGSHSAAAAPSVPVHTGSTTATSAVGPAGSPLVNEDEIDAEIVAEIDDSFAMLLSLTDSEQERAKVAVQTVQKMLQNLYTHKHDPKFRSIRMNNKAFQTRVGSVPGGVELLLAAGYRLESGDLPPPVSIERGTSDNASNSNNSSNNNILLSSGGAGSNNAGSGATSATATGSHISATNLLMMSSTAAGMSSNLHPDLVGLNNSSNREESVQVISSFAETEGYLLHDMTVKAEQQLHYALSRLSELLEMQSKV